jgi:hypothetical protein
VHGSAPSSQNLDGTSVGLPRMRGGWLDGTSCSDYSAATVTGSSAMSADRWQSDALHLRATSLPADLAVSRENVRRVMAANEEVMTLLNTRG